MIRFASVTRRFGRFTVLDEMDLEIEKGETFFIVGKSGAGKSVTLKHIVRLLTPDSGNVFIDDVNVGDLGGKDLEDMRSRIGYLFQGGALLQWLTIGDNVGLPLREHTQMREGAVDRAAIEKLKLVSLDGVFDKYPDELSGGMRKRAALARAIIRQPEIILYDEPTSGLDPVTSRAIDNLIESMRKELGVTSVVVTHDLHSALSIGSRIGMLFEGQLVEVAKPQDFIRSKNKAVQSFLASQYITAKGSWDHPDKP